MDSAESRGRDTGCRIDLTPDTPGIHDARPMGRLDNRVACRISLNRPGTIDDDSEVLEEINSWMITNLLKFKDVFGQQVAELKG